MPTVSMFYGVVIRLNPREHNPPHFHAIYQESEAVFDIRTGELKEGDLPLKQKRLVWAWWELHKDELLADWTLIQGGEEFFRIPPLCL